MNKNLLNNVTVIIRSAKEATLEVLKAQVLREVAEEDVFVIEEKPFSKAVKKTFDIGIQQNKKWTLALDADLILAPDAIKLMIKSANSYDNILYVYQGCILDKFLCTTKQGGPHLYLTQNLSVARDKFIKSDHGLRPESKIYHEMAEDKYLVIIEKKIFALHDFFQTLEDVYRKGYFHGIKHKLWKRLIPLWLEKSQSEYDYKIGIQGFIDGYFSEQKKYPDVDSLKNVAKEKIYNLNISSVKKSEFLNQDFKKILKNHEVIYDENLNIIIPKKPLVRKVIDKLKSFS